MPDTLAQYCISDTAGRAPYTPGTRIIFRTDPERGAMRVTGCRWVYGHWRVEYACESTPSITGSTAAERVEPAPEGFVDPPVCPNGCVASGLSAAAWRAKHEADMADPEHQAAMSEWERAYLRWLGEWGERR